MALLPSLLKALPAPPGDTVLYETALTHASFANEHGGAHNERLEFLGDALVGLVVARHLMDALPGSPEGALSKWKASIVSGETLAREGLRLGLGGMMRLGKGEAGPDGTRKATILAGAFEALVAAVFIDHGYELARAFVLERLAEVLSAARPSATPRTDPKSELQELLAAAGRAAPVYQTVHTEEGFRCTVFCLDEALGAGRGRTKKASQLAAAAKAVEKMRGEREEAASMPRALDRTRLYRP